MLWRTMADATKIGVAGMVLLLLAIGWGALGWPEPLPIVFAFISFVLGCIAALRGSRWWLILPGILLAGFCLALYAGFHAM